MEIIKRKIAGIEISEGAGVKINRLIGQPSFDSLDPFLLLDEFKSDQPGDYEKGFPNHPHRGFQTVTYMLTGKMRHQDNKGHSGVIGPGGVQWMHAGSGIIHSEMPEQEHGLLWGFQLWVNLPAKSKMTPAKYYEYDQNEIPVTQVDDATIKVISGRAPNGEQGALTDLVNDPIYFDVNLPKEGKINLSTIKDHNSFLYLYEGDLKLNGSVSIKTGDLIHLSPGATIEFEALIENDCRFLFIAAKPIGEPVARYGPFVMNTKEEISQAIADFRRGDF